MAKSYSRVKQVAARYGVSISTPWRWSNEARFAYLNFPKPIAIGPHARVWDDSELDAYDERRRALRDTSAT